MNSPRLLISGAGIAGLTLARCLDKLNIDYVLLEKCATSAHGSSGIALPFNAMLALKELGLRDRVLEVAHQVKEVIYTKRNGSVLARANLLEPPINQDKFVAMQRQQLHSLLLDGIESKINFNCTVDSFNSTQSGIDVICSDAALSGHYDLLVSAEGIHSKIRKQCFPTEETTINHNISNWRFIVDSPNHNLQPTYMIDRTEIFMVYPISDDQLYCYGHVYDETSRYNEGDPLTHIKHIFRNFADPARSVLDRLKDEVIVCSRMQSVRKPYFSRDRVVFIGDAGNACSPLLQQGAASAFEDAICLSDQLGKYPADKAIDEYKRIRTPKVEWIVNASDAPMKAVKAMRYPLLPSIRNLAIRKNGPLNVSGWTHIANEFMG